ncbi:hypothetical protein [Rhodobacter lacus]|uniref:Uncharacterized protein n=1 Tax=Rhodobacter lacus TaxID=1641972 RepID=A0ABW5ABT1_9RHOB
MTTVLLAAATVATFITFVLRLVRMRTILRFHWLADVAMTTLAFIIFQGTLGGTLVAVLSGLMFTIFLTLAKLAARFGATAMSLLRAYA